MIVSYCHLFLSNSPFCFCLYVDCLANRPFSCIYQRLCPSKNHSQIEIILYCEAGYISLNDILSKKKHGVRIHAFEEQKVHTIDKKSVGHFTAIYEYLQDNVGAMTIVNHSTKHYYPAEL